MRWHKCPPVEKTMTELVCPTCNGSRYVEVGVNVEDLIRPPIIKEMKRPCTGRRALLEGEELFKIKRELRHLSAKRLTQLSLARILQLLAADDKDVLMVEELRRRVDGESNS